LRKFFETLTAPPPADDSASEVPLAKKPKITLKKSMDNWEPLKMG
jgi:hypothetical protein